MAKKNFEIQWRELLLKKLKSPLKSLIRQHEQEQEKRKQRMEDLHTYKSPEEAHEAYGYGDITEEEYRLICDDFEGEESLSPVGAAHDELLSIVNRLKKDIKYFEWEALSDEEKQRIEQSNTELRERHESRRKEQSE